MKKILKFFLKAAYSLYRNVKIRTGRVSVKKRPRRYIHPDLGVERFFIEANKRNIQYAVLRWFEMLPMVEPGEDIDILVGDDDLDELDSLLNGRKGKGIPCDIYTCGGLPGTDHRSVPYFPPYKARELIENTVFYNGLVKVPSPYCHCFSMAYHIVYHKGYDSDIYSSIAGKHTEGASDHDYPRILNDIAEKAGIKLPDITLEQLDDFLNDNGWRPQNDTLKKLSKKNPWINDRFLKNESELHSFMSGVTIYIVREAAVESTEGIRALLWSEGFDILDEISIVGTLRDEAVHNIRGGNWNKGPWPYDGGLPAHAFLVLDYQPIPPDMVLSARHPGISNARIMHTKAKIRDYINASRSQDYKCNGVHSADSADEAFEYAKVLFPGKLKDLEGTIAGKYKQFETPFPVLKDMSRYSRRAKVELVDFHGSEAICKTFRPGRERFLEREILARKIGEGLGEVSEILETGSNYLVLKKYKNTLNKLCRLRPLFWRDGFLPIWIIRRLVQVIRHYRQQGYEMLDFSPANVLYSRSEGLKIIDFEYLQRGDRNTSSLEGNYAWYPVQESFQGDVPKQQWKKGAFPYYQRWLRRTGLPLLLCRKCERLPSIALLFSQLMYLFYFSLKNLRRRLVLLLRRVKAIIIQKIKKHL